SVAAGDQCQLGPAEDAGGAQGCRWRQQQCRPARARAPGEKEGGEQQQTARRQPLWPVWQVGNRPGEDALVLAIGIEQAPVTADCAFAGTLPRLVEGFDQVVLPAIFLGQPDETTNEQCLVDTTGQRSLALAAFAGPAGFADQDVLGCVGSAKGAAHLAHLLQGGVDA